MSNEEVKEEGYIITETEVTEVEIPVAKVPEKSFNDLDPFMKIRLAASQYGIQLKDPDKKCKKCYGRGYVSIQSKTQIPNPCICVFTDADKAKAMTAPPALSRKDRRMQERINSKRKK